MQSQSKYFASIKSIVKPKNDFFILVETLSKMHENWRGNPMALNNSYRHFTFFICFNFFLDQLIARTFFVFVSRFAHWDAGKSPGVDHLYCNRILTFPMPDVFVNSAHQPLLKIGPIFFLIVNIIMSLEANYLIVSQIFPDFQIGVHLIRLRF